MNDLLNDHWSMTELDDREHNPFLFSSIVGLILNHISPQLHTTQHTHTAHSHILNKKIENKKKRLQTILCHYSISFIIKRVFHNFRNSLLSKISIHFFWWKHGVMGGVKICFILNHNQTHAFSYSECEFFIFFLFCSKLMIKAKIEIRYVKSLLFWVKYDSMPISKGEIWSLKELNYSKTKNP